MTKIESQVAEWKAQYPGLLILVREGDFFESFGDDAATLAKVCGLTLTKRGETPMAGFPERSLGMRLKQLLVAGHRVAVAEAEAPG